MEMETKNLRENSITQPEAPSTPELQFEATRITPDQTDLPDRPDRVVEAEKVVLTEQSPQVSRQQVLRPEVVKDRVNQILDQAELSDILQATDLHGHDPADIANSVLEQAGQ